MTETPLAPGDEIELDITGIAHGGITVARHNGRVVFVSDAIPGEKVRAVVTEARKKKFARATVTQVIEASVDRRDHIWPEADVSRAPEDRAGGAEFGHIALARQRELKGEVLADAMQRFGGVEVRAEVEACPGDDETNGLGYRTRVRLHVDEQGVAGPYAARSRRVIPVTNLPLASDTINQIAPFGEELSGIASLDLVDPSADDARTLVSYPGEKARAGENDRLFERVGDREFQVRAGGFWQVHREAAGVLSRAVTAAIAGLAEAGRFDPLATNLDLYGGAGLLAAAVADAAGPQLKITTVESDAGATDDAAENLADLVGALAITARVDRYLAELVRAGAPVRERLARGTVVLDPPRSGAGGDVCAALAELAPANLVYVACDPVALARDTATLHEAGYELDSLRAFDLFPHTHHVEALAVFTKN